MALLLVQILDSPAKIRLVLFVIVALAAAGSFQSFDQLLTGNQDLIDDYERDPADHIERAGFEPNSFQHMLYEHRLYSKDIRGFFTTSNSAGSFAILATFAAVALFIEKFRNRLKESSYAPLVYCSIVAVAVAAGLIVTQSKGAIIAAAIAAGFLGVYLAFGGWLSAHRKAVFGVCTAAAVAGLAVMIWYGMSRGYLPGGNSMLVRWQYWTCSVKMYAAKPLTGVGGGNFATYYTHYKLPEALESVRDPHNFVLTLLTQYGPLGVIGFVAAFGCVLCKTIFAGPATDSADQRTNYKSFRVLAGAGLVTIVVALLVFRPILMADELGDDIWLTIYIFLELYIQPACMFTLVFWLLCILEVDEKRWEAGIVVSCIALMFIAQAVPHIFFDFLSLFIPLCSFLLCVFWFVKFKPTIRTKELSTSISWPIFCGIIAVLIHNLIDFAIFEPGVLTCFWTMIACLVAVDFKAGRYQSFVLRPSGAVRIAENPNRAGQLFAAAAAEDKLSPRALNLNGRLHMQYYRYSRDQQSMLTQAAQYFDAAVQRDKADFKNYEKLMIVYELLAEVSPANEADEWNQKAYDSGIETARRYPGKGRLQFELGKIAERLDDNDAALAHYKKAVQIEDSYRVQFRRMYPGREMFSRLGQNNYTWAKERIARLSD
jgi:hypothetical protein